MSARRLLSLRDYDAVRYGPFLGVSDDGSAATSICDAAAGSPKAQAIGSDQPFVVGMAHDAERLGSIGEVPVGPDQYKRIQRVSSERVLITTNVGSHVNLWHYRQPPTLDVTNGSGLETVTTWARTHGSYLRDRMPQPWLRLRFAPAVSLEDRLQALRAAVAEAPTCVVARSEGGVTESRAAIELAAAARAAVVVDGVARAPTEGRPALPGLLNYFSSLHASELLRYARQVGVEIEPALKVDTTSVANQIWTGLHAAQSMGLHLGKYGLFPLTFQEMAEVVRKVQGWMVDWTAAPAFYVDVPWIDGQRVYEPTDAVAATARWLELVAGCGAQIVLIDTVDKATTRHLVRTTDNDTRGVFSWEEIDHLREIADHAGLRVLWAGGIPLPQVRGFGRRAVFGIYVTTAAAELEPIDPAQEHDIGLFVRKIPSREKIMRVKVLLDAGFLAADTLDETAAAAEQGDERAASRLVTLVTERWRQKLGGPR